MNENVKITKDTQDYTTLGYGYINTYNKYFYTEDGRSAGKVVYYTYTAGGIESKHYSTRGYCCKGMFKASKVLA